MQAGECSCGWDPKGGEGDLFWSKIPREDHVNIAAERPAQYQCLP